MKTLVLDTSLQGITLAVCEISAHTVEFKEIFGSANPQEATARLPELCSNILKKVGWTVAEVDTVLVSHGPGSFTGIKIGLSFMSGWKRAGLPLKVYGVSSLKGLLTQKKDIHSLFLPATSTAGYFAVRDKGEVKVGVVDLSQQNPLVLRSEFEGDSASSSFDRSQLGQLEILGSWPKIEGWLGANNLAFRETKLDDIHPLVARGMVEDFIANLDKLSEGTLVPVYLRKSAPEEKLELDNQAKSQKQD